MIYLDNAATTMHKPPEVAEAVAAAINSMGNAARSTYESALSASEIIYDTRVQLAKLFHCSRADRVVFTANSTEALNIAINGVANQGDHMITTALEHNSVLRPLYKLEAEQKITLTIVPANKQGNIDYGELERQIRQETKAIICTHASNLTGNMLDLERIGAITARHGILLIADVSQTAGIFPIDMSSMHIDILCFTGHKGLLGPQGVGGLCIAEGIEVRPGKVGGTGIQSYSKTQPSEYPTRLEAGTLNGHGIAGLRAALGFIQSVGIDTIAWHEGDLAQRFYNGVKNVDGITVYGDYSAACRAAIVALNIWDYDSSLVADELSEAYGIAVRAGAHCAPLMHDALQTAEQGAVRFSFSWFTTEAEVDAAIRAVTELAESKNDN